MNEFIEAMMKLGNIKVIKSILFRNRKFSILFPVKLFESDEQSTRYWTSLNYSLTRKLPILLECIENLESGILTGKEKEIVLRKLEEVLQSELWRVKIGEKNWHRDEEGVYKGFINSILDIHPQMTINFLKKKIEFSNYGLSDEQVRIIEQQIRSREIEK